MATVILKPGAYTPKAAHASNVASLSGAGTYGGVALVAGEIVLLAGQSSPPQNGPYVIRAGAWDRIAHPGGTLRSGDSWYIESGTYAGKTYQLTTAGAIVLGTTSLTIAVFSGGGGMAPGAHATTHQNGGADVLTSHATTPANQVWAGPATGADAGPGFRALVAADIPPTLTGAKFGTQVQKTFLAGPVSGADASPTFRAIALLDLRSEVREVRVELCITGALPGVTAVWAAPGTVDGGLAAAARVFSPIQPGLGATPSWTLTGIYADLDTAPGGTDALTVTVHKSTGGAAYSATTATCTITGTAKAANDEAHNPTFTSGDWAAVRVQGGGSAAGLHVTLVFLRTA